MIESHEVTSNLGVVAANPPDAARIGARIFEAGGNAFDAAVAASMACCVLRPNQTGVGGYVCAAVVREGKTGRVWSVDSNGIAPAAAHEKMFEVLPAGDGAGDAWLNESEYHCSVKDHANVYGPLSVTVPGMMAGMGIIHEKWGRVPWRNVVTPSIELCERGFEYEEVAHAVMRHEKAIRRFPYSAKHVMPHGTLPAPSDRWHGVDLEKTLARVASAGWRDFYDGEIGRKIADHILELGGILTREDMAKFQPRITPPYSTRYRGATVSAAILPNGGISCLQALNLLECLELPAEESAEYWHLLVEVLKLVWRDRLNHLADPQFTKVPIDRLLSKEYAAGRVETLLRFPTHVDRLVPKPVHEGPNGTLHVSTADAEGNLVSMTISQGNSFGSCVAVPDTGVFLGHGMARLDPRPGLANSVVAGKRPLNNTCCLMIESPDRIVAAGAPGGRKIVSVMTRVAQMMVDRGVSCHAASTAQRMHVEANEPVQFLSTTPESTRETLRAMGHNPVVDAVICGVMNAAEFTIKERVTRAGSASCVTGV